MIKSSRCLWNTAIARAPGKVCIMSEILWGQESGFPVTYLHLLTFIERRACLCGVGGTAAPA